MRRNQHLLLVCALILMASDAMGQTKDQVAQTSDRSDPLTWKRYTVKGEQFSVALPTLPAMDYRKVSLARQGERLEISLGSYANGVVYTVFVFENVSPRQSLNLFSDLFSRGIKTLDQTTERKLTVDGVEGKAFTLEDGVAQFFANRDRLYQFVAFGSRPDAKLMEEFFSSISFQKNKDAVDVSDGPGEPYVPPPDSVAGQPVFFSREVNRKVRIAMKPEPSYTEAARQHRVKGIVVLRCVFASNGSVVNVRVASGLPDGLTEQAIAAARKIKFLPAIKDERHVSMWMVLEYNFDIY